LQRTGLRPAAEFQYALDRKMLESPVIPMSSSITARIAGSWQRLRYWDWNGKISADEAIVAVSLMRVGSHLEWARSEKELTSELDVRLLLGWHDSGGRDVQVSFFVGDHGPRWRTTLADADSPPKTLEDATIPLGRLFTFCEPFGVPQIDLFGLVLLREQVTGARNGLWHLKDSLRAGLPDIWQKILCYGRAGSATLPHDAA
jgi:hypothetical protein